MRTRVPTCLLLVLGGPAISTARADTGGVKVEAVEPRTAPDPNAPRIAPPAPSASPEDVEKAKQVAKEAALHPIVPGPQKPLRPAFQLYAEIDVPVLAIGLVFGTARTFRSQMAFCAPSSCDPSTLNRIDRWTAGYWSPGWQDVSDYGLWAIELGAATLLFVDEGFWHGLNDLVVVAETALAATALASIMTLAQGRPRPFLYGDEAPLAVRNSPDAGLSFLSSHAAVSFAIVTSTFMTMRRIHPGSRATWLVAGVGGAIAALVATGRVLGGMHFISDVTGGAIVGTSLGVLIPSLHASPVSVVPMAGADGQRGMALSLRF